MVDDATADESVEDVRHQAELSIDRIEKVVIVGPELEAAYRNLDEDTYEQLAVGESAPSFEFPDPVA